MSIVPSFFGKRSNIFDPFSLDVWDPFHSLDVWDPFHGSPFRSLVENGLNFPGETSVMTQAKIGWKDTQNAHVFKADIPGLKKEEVKVEVEDGNVLKISGERNRNLEEKNDSWHRVERSSSKFIRRFRLPENAKVDQVKASMDNGVLTVTVPKEENKIKKLDTKSIDISG